MNADTLYGQVCKRVNLTTTHTYTQRETHKSAHIFICIFVYGHWFWCTYKSKIASFHLLRSRRTVNKSMKWSDRVKESCDTLPMEQLLIACETPFFFLFIQTFSFASCTFLWCANCQIFFDIELHELLQFYFIYIYIDHVSNNSSSNSCSNEAKTNKKKTMCINKFYCRHNSNNTRLTVVTKWKFYKRSVSYDLISINHSFHS